MLEEENNLKDSYVDELKSFHFDKPFKNQRFFVKGMENVGWGMKDRLAHIFDRRSGNTVMLMCDHGYVMGPTPGLERLDIVIPKLLNYADCIMATRGAVTSCCPPTYNKPLILRASAGSTVLADDFCHEPIGIAIEDAIRLNASCIAIQTFIGTKGEEASLENLVHAIDDGNKYGIPTMGVVDTGGDYERSSKFFIMSSRILHELGAHIIKTYYCDNFEKLAGSVAVPVIASVGKKLSEKEVLEIAYKAIDSGASGVDMGRNIFQARYPIAMVKALSLIVHHRVSAKKAYEFYEKKKK